MLKSLLFNTALLLVGFGNAQWFDSTQNSTCFTNKFKPTFNVKSKYIDTCASSIDINVSYTGKPYYAYWNDGYSGINRKINYSGNYQLYLFDSLKCVDTSIILNVTLRNTYLYAYTENGTREITICDGNTTYLYVYHDRPIKWNTGETTSSIAVNQAGNYIVTASDSNACGTTSDTLKVNVVNPKRLKVTVKGNTEFCLGDSCILEINTPDSNIYWLPYYDFGTKITVRTSGLYRVYYVDKTYGCGIYSDSVQVTVNTPKPFNLCMVTNDSASGHNKIVWKPQSWVSTYKVYRETNISGEFEMLAELKGASNDFYIDSTSKPKTRAYTYYVDAFDTCGNAAVENQFYRHTTLHLTANLGVSGENNLNWSDYYGIYPINTYNIYRSNNGGEFKKIASVSASVKAYSDFEPPSGTNRYRIGIDADTDCTDNTQSLLSNMVAFGILDSKELNLSGLSVSPNPSTDAIRIVGIDSEVRVKIFTSSGWLCKELVYSSADQWISLQDLTQGIYVVQINDSVSLRLVKM